MLNRQMILLVMILLFTVTACSAPAVPLDFPDGKDRQPVNTGLSK